MRPLGPGPGPMGPYRALLGPDMGLIWGPISDPIWLRYFSILGHAGIIQDCRRQTEVTVATK